MAYQRKWIDEDVDGAGCSRLYVMATNGVTEVVRAMVDAGAGAGVLNKATEEFGFTPLIMAAHEGHVEVVRCLVEAGADKDKARTDNRATPLFMASQEGHVEVVRCLVEAGADKNKATEVGATPRDVATAAVAGILENTRERVSGQVSE